jgi:endonuclease/exonuclease/phosphatase family metal-dependent hydrolase
LLLVLLDRHPELLEIVRRYNPDIIAFQEVTMGFLKYLDSVSLFSKITPFEKLTKLPWIREDYYLSDVSDNCKTFEGDFYGYGCVLLSRLRPTHLKIHQFPTRMGRRLTYMTFDINNEKWAIGTVHLGIAKN